VSFDLEERQECPIQGQLLRCSRRRLVAIYLRGDSLWVADFIEGRGEIIDARVWFRFNCASAAPSQMRRRMLLESAMPLSSDLVDKVEKLHQSRHAAKIADMRVRAQATSWSDDNGTKR
jgi:hypothetical protein